jgi:predicted O-linked N-acetylglucosamine transferase (SPINDLY family)
VDIQASVTEATERHREGKLDEAEAILRSVLRQEPGHPRALFQLGVIALERGRPADAEMLLRRATAAHRNAVATMALADAIEKQGRAKEAEATLREAVQIDAGLAEGWARLSTLLAARGARDEAVWALAVVTRLKPRDARHWNNLAALQLTAQRHPEAERAARQALEIAPDHALAWSNLGRALGAKGDEEGAANALRQAVAHDPSLGEAHYWLAVSLVRRRAWTEALDHFRRAADAIPRWVEPLIGIGSALAQLARRREAVEAFAEAARVAAPRAREIESQRLFVMQYGDEFGSEEVSQAHLDWGRRFAPPGAARPSPRPGRPGRRIRVGYVSPRFQVSSMAFALLPVLARHDRRRFEVYCYAENEAFDATSGRFQGFADSWRETQDFNDEQLAKLIATDGIDILVDLAGHTPGNRLAVFARRPAPLAVSWLDYFNTTGVEAIDALVADDVALATPLAQQFVEKPVSVGPVRYPYEPPPYAPDVVPAREGAVAFGSFARLAKITDAAFEAWSALLVRVPTSRLLLKNDSLDDAFVKRSVHEAFQRHGIDPARIELRGASPHEQMLRELGEVDVVLDTFPYNGGITTLEALWMGRPVVTVRGDTLVGRQGAAILAAAGLGDLVAADLAAYQELAARLAADAARRAGLARTLRETLRTSPIGDTASFTRRLESLFERLLLEHAPPP